MVPRARSAVGDQLLVADLARHLQGARHGVRGGAALTEGTFELRPRCQRPGDAVLVAQLLEDAESLILGFECGLIPPLERHDRGHVAARLGLAAPPAYLLGDLEGLEVPRHRLVEAAPQAIDVPEVVE